MSKKVKQIMACVLAFLLMAIQLPELSGGIAYAASNNIISTVAGTGVAGYSGDGGSATLAKLNGPGGMALDSSGNLYITDYSNHRIRKVDKSTGNISTVAGTGVAGYSGDGGPATSAQLRIPRGVAVDSSGNLYIADYGNHMIRKVNQSTGKISKVAGTAFLSSGVSGFSGDGGLATSARLDNPGDVAVDSSGNLYIADTENQRIRKVDQLTGNISTVAGTGTIGHSGDGGAPTSAQLSMPLGLAIDSSNNLYIAENGNTIRKLVLSTNAISTVAGTGVGASYSGDGGPATSATMSNVNDVAVDSSGNLYIADTNNQRLRKVDHSTGKISTMAGTGVAGYSGDEGPATSAQLMTPTGVAVDSSGILYIGDSLNQRVRKVGQSSDANLNSLTLSSGSLSPGFASGTTSYTASVTNSVYDITVTPTVADSTATVKVNGTSVTSGSASGAISLNAGSNPITV
ncbi:hypothetical protein GC102_16460, partial [Paenibacillus sp. LMG 31460]